MKTDRFYWGGVTLLAAILALAVTAAPGNSNQKPSIPNYTNAPTSAPVYVQTTPNP